MCDSTEYPLHLIRLSLLGKLSSIHTTKYFLGISPEKVHVTVPNCKSILGECLLRLIELLGGTTYILTASENTSTKVEHVKMLVLSESCLVFHPENHAVKVTTLRWHNFIYYQIVCRHSFLFPVNFRALPSVWQVAFKQKVPSQIFVKRYFSATDNPFYTYRTTLKERLLPDI